MTDKITLLVDFDGTIFEEGYYPDVGPEVPGAVDSINRLYNTGRFYVIVFSCRENEDMEAAILALEEAGCKYHDFNHSNPSHVAKYGQDPRKIWGDIVIDDRSLPYLLKGVHWPTIMKEIETYLETNE